MTTDPSTTRKAEIRERLDAATPGPWSRFGREIGNEDGDSWFLGHDIEGPPEAQRGQFERVADAELIAHAPADLRWALDRIEELEGERDRARATAVALEQQLDEVRAGLVVTAGEVYGYPERHTDEYVRGQYETARHSVAIALEATGEVYVETSPTDAAEELARRWSLGVAAHAGQMIPEALELDEEPRDDA